MLRTTDDTVAVELVADSHSPQNIEQTFSQLCQLHNEICGIVTQTNHIWRYAILMLLGNSFLMTVAQLYFMYCAIDEEVLTQSLQ